MTRTATLVSSWGRRASVRRRHHPLEPGSGEDTGFRPDRPDYPPRLVPALVQARLATADSEQWSRVLTLAWLTYNVRVIGAEEQVAVPALKLLLSGRYPSLDTPEMRQALRQTIIDEEFHSYLHMLAIDESAKRRGVELPAGSPRSTIIERCVEASDGCRHDWQRDLVLIVWMIVAEVSINAYLTLLSTDGDIQPMHRLIPALHAKDEAAHSAFMIDMAVRLYRDLSGDERVFFEAMLGPAVQAFSEQDLRGWDFIVATCGAYDENPLSAPLPLSSDAGLLVRDFSGIERLARRLQLTIAHQ